MIKTIYMDPACKMNYASFYILGLKEIFGKKAKFSTKHFHNLIESEQCFLFVVEKEDALLKVAVDFHDSRKLEMNILEWSDLYAKINLNDLSYDNLEIEFGDDYRNQKNKIISIPPSFGIRIFSIIKTIKHILYLIFNFWGNKKLKIYLMDVLRMYFKRLPITFYKPEKHTVNYIFFIASIWHTATSYINITRANFIRACKKIKGINFEGGFVDIGYECDYIKDLQILMYREKKILLKHFIQKTKKSTLVFNNPSVAYCHGWKLAEYLCMGKAIISVPLSNRLPVDLIHEKNTYFTEDTEDAIYNAVRHLLENPELIATLEQNSEKYWNSYASPSSVIKLLISNLP